MADSKPHIQGKRILVVDDEQDILDTIAEILETAHVDRAGSYAAASRTRPASSGKNANSARRTKSCRLLSTSRSEGTVSVSAS